MAFRIDLVTEWKEWFRPDRKRKRTSDQAGECSCSGCEYSFRNYKVVCPFAGCEIEACVNCVHRYLMGSSERAHCMNCRRPWTDEFVRQTFTNKMLQEQSGKWQQELVNREKARLPEAQQAINERRERQERIAAAQREIRELRERIVDLENEIVRRSSASVLPADRLTSLSEAHKCPLDGCRGFLLDGVCGLCRTRLCTRCWQAESGPDHRCLPEQVADVDYLRQHTRPCPTCGYRTSRVDGCPQMWCTECHRGWNWETGRVETGRIHNPHLEEWRTRHHQDENANQEDPSLATLVRCCFLIRPEELRALVELVDRVRASHPEPRECSTIYLRMDYLQKYIDEKAMGKALLRRDEERRIERQFYEIHLRFVTSMTELMRRLTTVVAHDPFPQRLAAEYKVWGDMHEVRRHYNRQLLLCSKRLNKRNFRQFDFVSSSWAIVHPREYGPAVAVMAESAGSAPATT